MEFTNKHGLPDALVRAVEAFRDKYDPGESDITVTSLIDSPRILQLKKKHEHEIVEDVMDNVWSLLGSAVHQILEEAEAEGMAEERLYHKIDGVNIGGQFDNLALEDGILTDYKCTSAWSVVFGKKDWEYQLNILRLLAEENGFVINRMEICAILRDWTKNNTYQSNSYPKRQVVRIPIIKIPNAQLLKYIKDRLKKHKAAEKKLPLCTADERWAQPDKWALMKKGAKRATRVFDNEAEANKMRKHNPGTTVVHRPGSSRRCEEYCSLLPFCSQGKKITGGK